MKKNIGQTQIFNRGFSSALAFSVRMLIVISLLNATLLATFPSQVDASTGAARSLTVDSLATSEITIDNPSTSLEVTVVGTWTSSTIVSGYQGSDYIHNEHSPDAESVRYTPTIGSCGTYEVFAWWTAQTNRATNTPIVIHDGNGVDTTVPVNQQTNGGQWNSLGSYQFTAGTSGYVEIRTEGADGVVIADGMRFVKVNSNCAASGEITIDNQDSAPAVTINGAWATSSLVNEFWVDDYFHNEFKPDAVSIRFTPTIASCGTYEVYAWWTTHANRATNTPVIVHEGSGADTTYTVNQEVNGGQWNLLGTHVFDAGDANYVEFQTEDADGVVIVDAVRFVPVSNSCSSVEEVIVDNQDSAPTLIATGTWTTSTIIDSYWADNYIHNEFSPDADSVRFTPTIASCGEYEVYAWWTSHENRATNTSIVIHDGQGTDTTVHVNQEVNGGQWNLLGTYPLVSGADNYVEIQTAGADDVVIADAIRFLKVNDNCALEEIILDNPENVSQVTVKGTWIPSTVISGYFEENYIHNMGSPDAESVRFTPVIESCGNYEVYAHWTTHPNRATNTPIVIHEGGGADTTVNANQQIDGGQWNLLGTHQFMAGTANYVEFQTAGADGVVIVDGVRFVQVNTNCDNNLLPSEIIIDNDDGSPTVSEIGDWDRSTIIAGYYGPDYIENLDHPDAEAVRFTPNLPSCGNYEVYGWWTTHPNRATNTPIIIHDDTGTDNLVRANQQENTAQWNLLGTYQFAAGSSNYVEFRVDDANGVVIADAVRFVQVDTTCSESEIVIDNLDGAPTVTLNGSWTESTVIPGFWEDNYIHDRDTPDAESVRFTPEINSCGTYNVYAQWTSDTNRATNTPIVIRDANGPNAPITVNQEINGGQWNLLGSYPFAAGTDNYVEIQTDGADGVVIVDAVRFVQIDTTCSVSEIVIDNLDSSPAFTKVGTWIDSTIVSGYWSDNYIHNENSPDAESVRFTPTIDTCGTYEVFARWTEHGNRATNTPIVVHDGEGFNTTSVVNQQTDGGEWNSIGVYPFAVGTSNYVEVQTAGADGVVIADAVRFMRTSNTCPEQTEMIIDNRDGSPIVTTVGTWFDSTIVSGFWADNYIHNEHSPDAQSVRFTPTIGSCGQYEVFTRWTTHQNRATNTPIVIHDWNGTNTTVTVNQEINGGQWNSIGVYSFASGTSNYVEFQTAGADDVVIVDAVRLVKVSQTCNASPSTAPTAAYLAIPDGLTGVNGSSVSIPVNVEEANVATSAAFTLNFNPSCLSVNTADGNNDGLPDAITLNQADDYVLGVNADNASNGTVRFVVSPPGTTSALPTFDVGALVTVNANVQCNSNTAIAISDYSFGGIDGQPVNALAQGNTISMLQAPVAVDDTGRSEHGATILIDVLANDDSTLDIISVTQPANGTVTIQSGQVQYVPNTGFAGVDTFSYTVRDGNGLTDSSQVQIGVGTTSDCNHQGTVEAADLPAIILEIFDGDSNNWLSVEGGSFGGNPVGCDSNASSAIEAGDISCTIRHLLGESTCTLTARSARQQAAELTVSDSWTIENEQVTIPIEFISHGNRIGAVSMSLDIEPSQLIFDTETGVLNIPDGYQASVNVRGRTLGIVLFTMNLDNALQDGEIASLTFDLVDGTIGQAELSNAIGFSMISDTTVGGVNGQSVPSISHPQRGAVFVPSVWK